MKHLKKHAKLLVILFIFTLSSCSSVPVYNSEFCGDLGKAGATCFHTLSENTRNIAKADWDRVSPLKEGEARNPNERFGMVCAQPEVFMDWKASIEKLCRITKKCIYKREMNSFFSKVEDVGVKTSNNNNN